MDKQEYRLKTEQMFKLAGKKSYKEAMEIADSIDWGKVKNTSILCAVSEIYEANGEFQKGRELLLSAYERATDSKKIIYRLGMLALKLDDVKEATECYEEFLKVAPKDAVFFDELGIGTLFVDEAHNYKNLPIRTNLKNLNGINTKGSTKCQDLLHKVRHIQQNNGGRGIVFATGTPLCNSISDAYAMQMYLQYDELQKSHLDVFDNWVKTFARPEQTATLMSSSPTL
mgnify:CR=1 FL=1